jgi:hypothetical protein
VTFLSKIYNALSPKIAGCPVVFFALREEILVVPIRNSCVPIESTEKLEAHSTHSSTLNHQSTMSKGEVNLIVLIITQMHQNNDSLSYYEYAFLCLFFFCLKPILHPQIDAFQLNEASCTVLFGFNDKTASPPQEEICADLEGNNDKVILALI